jgi:hypothetical protein
MQAVITTKPGSPYLFAVTKANGSWALTTEDSKNLKVGQPVEIAIADQADQFCQIVALTAPQLDIFLAIDNYKVQLRCYTGNQTIDELHQKEASIKKEANNMALSLGLDTPRAPYVTSTFQGVTLIIEIPLPRPTTDALYTQISDYQKLNKWKLSRK